MDTRRTTPPPSGIVDARPSERGKARAGLLVVAALVVVALVAGGILLASGDGSSIDTESSSAGGGSAASSESTPLPDFTADLRDGGTLDSADIEGPAVIQVFASWCPTCQQHAPDVAKLQQEEGDLDFYYLNVADEAEPAAAFIERYEWADAPVLIDDDREIQGEFGLTGQPNTIFVNADGEVVDVIRGGGTLDDLREGATLAQQA